MTLGLLSFVACLLYTNCMHKFYVNAPSQLVYGTALVSCLMTIMLIRKVENEEDDHLLKIKLPANLRTQQFISALLIAVAAMIIWQ